MADRVRLGIVGIGNMGSAHLHCVAKGEVEGLIVTALCDSDPLKREEIKQKYPDLPLFADYGEMLREGETDAVLIATPHPLHTEMAIAALEAGKHVLLEKPADISLSKAEGLNAVAEKSGKVFGIMFNQRTNLLFQKARELVRGGALGELQRTNWIITNWYRTQHYYDSGSWRATWAGEGGGVLLNQAPHNLDLWQWICGMPKSIAAVCHVAKYHQIEVEDEAILYATYENGATGMFITSTGEYPGTNRLEVVGSQSKLVIEDGVLKHWALDKDVREVSRTVAENFTSIGKTLREYSFPTEQGHRAILQNFTDAILKGEALLAPGSDGILELSLSNAAYLSAWQGSKEIAFPMDTAAFDAALAEKAAASRVKEGESAALSEEYNTRWKVKW